MRKRYTIEKHVPTMPPEFRDVLLGATDSLEEAETVYQCARTVVRHDVKVRIFCGTECVKSSADE